MCYQFMPTLMCVSIQSIYDLSCKGMFYFYYPPLCSDNKYSKGILTNEYTP